MIFGDKYKFAIEFVWEQVIDSQNFGRFFFWIHGERIGDPEDRGVYLNGCINWLIDCYEEQHDRREAKLYEMSTRDAQHILASAFSSFATVETYLYGPFGNIQGRFLVDHIGMSSFENFYVALVESESGAQRFIWWQKNGEAKDAFFPPGEFEKRAREVVAWCKSHLEHMPAPPPAKMSSRKPRPN